MQIGYKLAPEALGSDELIRQAVAAEEAGFDFVELSYHFHPWLNVQEHSPFTWTVLGILAAETERVGLATGVTCPTFRYHPAIIAQAAATTVREEDIRQMFPCGPDPEVHLQRIKQYVDASFYHIVVQNNGPTPTASSTSGAGSWRSRCGRWPLRGGRVTGEDDEEDRVGAKPRALRRHAGERAVGARPR